MMAALRASHRGGSLGCCLPGRHSGGGRSRWLARDRSIGIVEGLQGGFGEEDFLRALVDERLLSGGEEIAIYDGQSDGHL